MFNIIDNKLINYTPEEGEKDVVIPEGVTEIGPECFMMCSQVESVYIPTTVRVIGNNAFYYCSRLKRVEFAEGITEILYGGNFTDSKVKKPKTVIIEMDVFMGCIRLKNIILPESLVRIQSEVFAPAPWGEQEDALIMANSHLLYRCNINDECVGLPDGIRELGEGSFLHSSASGLILPEGIEELRENTFYSCVHLKEIVLPSTLRRIGDYAFSCCTGLETVSVRGKQPVKGWCQLPDTPCYVGREAFGHCGFDTVVIPKGYRADKTEAFAFCDMRHVIVEEGVRHLGISMFSKCEQLIDVKLPSSMQYIDEALFSGCTALTQINIPDRVMFINRYAFNDCSALKSIVLPDSISVIESMAFSNCSSLESISLPKSLKSLTYGVFRRTGLREVVIPDSVTEIISHAFICCRELESITLPKNLKKIDDGAFSDCSKLKSLDIPYGVTEIPDNMASYCTELVSVTIPESVTKIGDRAFSYCSSLRELRIPDSVEDIGIMLVMICNSLEKVYISKKVTRISDIGIYDNSGCAMCAPSVSVSSLPKHLKPAAAAGVAVMLEEGIPMLPYVEERGRRYIRMQRTKLYSTALKCYPLLRYMMTERMIPLADIDSLLDMSGNDLELRTMILQYKDENFSVEDELKLLNRELQRNPDTLAFHKQTWGLKKLPDNCLKITSYKGEDTEVTVPETICGMRVTEIGDRAFSTDSGRTTEKVKAARRRIRRIVLPDGLQRIGKLAFAGITALESMVIPDTVSEIGKLTFFGCSALESVSLPEGIGEISEGMFINCTSLRNVRIPHSAEIVQDNAFLNCSALTEMIFPDKLRIIGIGAFKGCFALSSVKLSAALTYIGTGAFQNTSIEEIDIPEGVKVLPWYLFTYCPKLKRVRLPESLECIDGYAFAQCGSLEELVLPDGLVTLGRQVFSGCPIKKMKMPDSLLRIEDDCFGYTPALKKMLVRNGSLAFKMFYNKGYNFIVELYK